MGDHVGGNLGQPWFGTHQFAQLSPATFHSLSRSRILFVFDDFVDVFVQLVDLGTVAINLDQTTFVVDRNRGTVIDRVLNVVDADVVAEDAASVFVFLVNRRAGEADELRLGNASRMCLA